MLQTVAEPPYDGSTSRAIIGCTTNSSPAPMKAVVVNSTTSPIDRGGAGDLASLERPRIIVSVIGLPPGWRLKPLSPLHGRNDRFAKKSHVDFSGFRGNVQSGHTTLWLAWVLR